MSLVKDFSQKFLSNTAILKLNFVRLLYRKPGTADVSHIFGENRMVKNWTLGHAGKV